MENVEERNRRKPKRWTQRKFSTKLRPKITLRVDKVNRIEPK